MGTPRAVLAVVLSPHRVPIGLIAGVAIALIMACGNDGHEEDDTQFRKDVIWCEEAVAHLEECCGGAFDATQVTCRHFYSKDEGCGNTSITRIDPAYTTDESECIRDQSCDAIRANKVCERALAAGEARAAYYNSDTNTTSGLVSSSSTSGTVTSSSTSGSSTSGPICP